MFGHPAFLNLKLFKRHHDVCCSFFLFICTGIVVVGDLQRNRRNRIQDPRHLIRRHLAVLHTPDLASLAQALESDGEFPALGLVDEEDVALAVGVADRGAEDVEVFGGLCAGL
tara:strand:+ start:8324 stop:8662 length:339 start_codon:yes stop_codon:yes gene_type:complete